MGLNGSYCNCFISMWILNLKYTDKFCCQLPEFKVGSRHWCQHKVRLAYQLALQLFIKSVDCAHHVEASIVNKENLLG